MKSRSSPRALLQQRCDDAENLARTVEGATPCA